RRRFIRGPRGTTGSRAHLSRARVPSLRPSVCKFHVSTYADRDGTSDKAAVADAICSRVYDRNTRFGHHACTREREEKAPAGAGTALLCASKCKCGGAAQASHRENPYPKNRTISVIFLSSAIRRESLASIGVQSMKARDLMTSEVIAVRPETPTDHVAKLLFEHRIGACPVIDENGA